MDMSADYSDNCSPNDAKKERGDNHPITDFLPIFGQRHEEEEEKKVHSEPQKENIELPKKHQIVPEKNLSVE